jgi:hypothetical protein
MEKKISGEPVKDIQLIEQPVILISRTARQKSKKPRKKSPLERSLSENDLQAKMTALHEAPDQTLLAVCATIPILCKLTALEQQVTALKKEINLSRQVEYVKINELFTIVDESRKLQKVSALNNYLARGFMMCNLGLVLYNLYRIVNL